MYESVNVCVMLLLNLRCSDCRLRVLRTAAAAALAVPRTSFHAPAAATDNITITATNQPFSAAAC